MANNFMEMIDQIVDEKFNENDGDEKIYASYKSISEANGLTVLPWDEYDELSKEGIRNAYRAFAKTKNRIDEAKAKGDAQGIIQAILDHIDAMNHRIDEAVKKREEESFSIQPNVYGTKPTLH